MTREQKRELISTANTIGATLDGAPAVIMGAAYQFATVKRLDGQGQAEYTWAAVKRVVANGGAFKAYSK